uniref:ATP synthase subunit a n=1 Tax=Cyema atrum TaxID=556252 RepID=D1YUE3_9TELE|nr:ATP synthase F0 subunit 6 [Cyema atrum]BAI53527.1 ATPase subunit 6 [Cyema atrum]
MTLDIFHQFVSPTLLGVPLLAIALTLPWIIYPTPTMRWLNSRALALQGWLIRQFTQQLLQPLNLGAHPWAALFVSLMLLLLTTNTLGLLPYTFTPTTQLSMSMAFAVPLWMSTVLTGMRNQTNEALAHLLPTGTPTPLIPVLIIIETVSLFIRPLALGMRLTANLTAGHLMMFLISTVAYILMPIMPKVALITVVVLGLLTLLEMAVAVIQAYVFVLLLSLYLQENV